VSRARQTLVLLNFFLMLGIIVAVSRYMIWVKPWRSSQIEFLIPVAIFFGAMICWISRRHGKILISWTASAIFLGFCTVLLYSNAYRTHYQQNMPHLWTSLDLDRVDLVSIKDILSLGKTDLARKELFKHFQARSPLDPSKYPLVGGYSSRTESLKSAESLLAFKFEFPGNEPVQLPINLSWSENPFQDITWTWSLHSMRYLSALIESYKITGEVKYLKRAEDLILGWIRNNSSYIFNPPSEFSWGDHSTAIRINVWQSFWELWIVSSLSDEFKMEKILRSILGHAERLSDPKFYTFNHNHGIAQDIALISISSGFPEFKKSDEWLSLSVSRLKEQIDFAVSPDGIHLEHSPDYQLFTLTYLSELFEMASNRNITELNNTDFEEIILKMARFAAYLIQPDGRLPPLGDTAWSSPLGTDHGVLFKYAKKDPFLLYMLTRGREGEPVPDAVAFLKEGYVILREWWGQDFDFGKSLQIVFSAASNQGLSHKHSDDLSFTIFCGGEEILIDPGRYSYKPDAFRHYIISSHAHNVVVVDDERQEKSILFGDGKAKIGKSILANRYALIEGVKETDKIIHTRTLLFVRPDNLFVIDELVPSQRDYENTKRLSSHTFNQLFHFGPNIEIQADETRSVVNAYRKFTETGPVLQIMQLADGAGTLEIFRGSNDPFLGWASRGHGEIEPVPTAQFTARGSMSTFVTFIRIRSPYIQVEKPALERESFGFEVNKQRIFLQWKVEDRDRQITIARGEQLFVHLSEDDSYSPEKTIMVSDSPSF
jgi:hypothetical protein